MTFTEKDYDEIYTQVVGELRDRTNPVRIMGFNAIKGDRVAYSVFELLKSSPLIVSFTIEPVVTMEVIQTLLVIGVGLGYRLSQREVEGKGIEEVLRGIERATEGQDS